MKINEFNQFFTRRWDDISSLTDNIHNHCDINLISDTFISIFKNISDKILSESRRNKNGNYQPRNKKPWFKADCYTAMLQFNKALNVFVRNKSDNK